LTARAASGKEHQRPAWSPHALVFVTWTPARCIARSPGLLQKHVDVHDEKAVAALCRKWKPRSPAWTTRCAWLVDGYYPARKSAPRNQRGRSRTSPRAQVREWMKKTQRDCIQFGISSWKAATFGTNVFPETDFKFISTPRWTNVPSARAAEGVTENLAARDERDSQRAAARS